MGRPHPPAPAKRQTEDIAGAGVVTEGRRHGVEAEKGAGVITEGWREAWKRRCRPCSLLSSEREHCWRGKLSCLAEYCDGRNNLGGVFNFGEADPVFFACTVYFGTGGGGLISVETYFGQNLF